MAECACSQAGGSGEDQDPQCTRPHASDLIEIDRDPYVGETPPEGLVSWLTPNRLFYVRNHFDPPSLDAGSWRLRVAGHVDRPLTLDLSHLLRLPRRTLPAVLECAGNNRSDLEPPVPGNPFRRGAVSNAVWCGVPLREVLSAAKPREGAVEVLFKGADAGEPEPGVPPTDYLRSLPMEVATHPDTLLAYEMNGEPLPPAHGYPLRLVVPGVVRHGVGQVADGSPGPGPALPRLFPRGPVHYAG